MRSPGNVRVAHEGDAAKIGTLFEKVFGFSRRMEHYQWKFLENPTGLQLIVVAETEGGDIVGQYALWPVMLQLERREYLGAQSLDTMIHPDYRGKGMFMTLANACYEIAAAQGVKVLYGFPNPSSYRGFIRRLNWDHTGDIPYFFKPIY